MVVYLHLLSRLEILQAPAGTTTFRELLAQSHELTGDYPKSAKEAVEAVSQEYEKMAGCPIRYDARTAEITLSTVMPWGKTFVDYRYVSKDVEPEMTFRPVVPDFEAMAWTVLAVSAAAFALVMLYGRLKRRRGTKAAREQSD